MRTLIYSVLIAIIVAISTPLTALSDFGEKQQQATLLYENGEFKSAYSQYRKLAREGDEFSQYRVSYMNLMGQGGKEDVIESLAWAVLAAQNQQENMVDYMQTVAGLVPENKRKKADKKIAQYLRKWGNDIGSSSGQKSDYECTGTRLCNHSSGPKRVRMPSNLWSGNDTIDDSGNPSNQQLKGKAIDLNESILELFESPGGTTPANQGTG
jgi:hypothetical protein